MYTVNVLLSWGSNNVLCSFRGYLRFGWNQVALVSLDYVGWPACMHAFIRHIRSTAHTDGGIQAGMCHKQFLHWRARRVMFKKCAVHVACINTAQK
jgi:hypothetical protein